MRNIRAFVSPFCLLSSLGICPANMHSPLCVFFVLFELHLDAFDEEGNEAKPNRNCVPFLVFLLLDFSMNSGVFLISILCVLYWKIRIQGMLYEFDSFFSAEKHTFTVTSN